MNKGELVDFLAKEAELTKAEAKRAVDGLVNIVGDTLKAGETVALPGFGTWSVRERPAREGRNPRTGEKMLIAAAKIATFKPGKQLKTLVADS